jgi:hypothetical protein
MNGGITLFDSIDQLAAQRNANAGAAKMASAPAPAASLADLPPIAWIAIIGAIIYMWL